VVATVPRKSLRDKGHLADARYQMKAWTEVIEKYSRPWPTIITASGTSANTIITNGMKEVRTGKQNPKAALDETARVLQDAVDRGYKELGL
jgi:ABC-type glycerol-3-phosphate transport system substrate-binding protein